MHEVSKRTKWNIFEFSVQQVQFGNFKILDMGFYFRLFLKVSNI